MDPLPRRTPSSEEELLAKVQRISDEAVSLGRRQHELIGDVADAQEFLVEYVTLLGPSFAELDRIETRIADLEAAQNPEDAAARRAAYRANERLQLTSTTVKQMRLPAYSFHFAPTDEIGYVYQRVVRLIHPDLVVSEDEQARRTELMQQASSAYVQRDLPTLIEMLASEAAHGNVGLGSTTEERLGNANRIIEQIFHRMEAINKKEDQLRGSAVSRMRVSGKGNLGRLGVALARHISTAKKALAELEAQ